MPSNKKIRVHFKSNHADPDSFPPTIEGESVFAITEERYRDAIERFPDLKGKIDPVFDWDLDKFVYYKLFITNLILYCR